MKEEEYERIRREKGWLKVELPEGEAEKVYHMFANKYFNGKLLIMGLEADKYLIVPNSRWDFIQYLANVYGVVVIS